ncbi:hypothetical protein U1Q18_022737 [Sarracenia purpurea var. burkii]
MGRVLSLASRGEVRCTEEKENFSDSGPWQRNQPLDFSGGVVLSHRSVLDSGHFRNLIGGEDILLIDGELSL